MKPVVALVGRPNVGKSSLFNRILRRKKALVEDQPGVTRDRNYAVAEYEGRSFILVDTGGFEDEEAAPENRKALARLVREAASAAVEEADVVVIVLDGKDGVNPADGELVDFVRQSRKPALHAVNKIDHTRHVDNIYDFYELGIEDAIPISASHGLGLDDLMDAVLAKLPEKRVGEAVPEPWADKGKKKRQRRTDRGETRLADGMAEEPVTGPTGWREPATDPQQGQDGDEVKAAGKEPIEVAFDGEGEGDDFTLRVAVLGRPNVGKSTLINQLLGFERCLVSDVAGTTRDSVDTYVELDGRRLILIDTAGIRRRARISEKVEHMTVQRALRMIEAAHIVLLMLDATEGITEQDARLGSLAESRGRGIVVLANKWDQVRNKGRQLKELRKSVEQSLPHLSFAPVLTLSALKGDGLDALLPALDTVDRSHRSRVATAALNRWLDEATTVQPPPLHHHHAVRLYYATQAGIRPPRIIVFSNDPDGVPEHYRRYLTNRFRQTFDLKGTPVMLAIRKR